MTTRRWGALGRVALAVGLGVAAGSALSSTAEAKPSSPLVKSLHIGFENCSAKTTVMTARVLRLTYTTIEPILIGITIKNDSSTACGPKTAQGPAVGAVAIAFGPCGNVALEFDNAKRQNVYPGPLDAPSCALQTATPLPAHKTLSGTGIWNQQLGQGGTQQVPAGRYTIVVQHRRLFTITLEGGAGGTGPSTVRPFTPSPPGACGRIFSLIGAGATASALGAAATTATTGPLPRCPIGSVQVPSGGSTPTPTIPPSPTTTPPSTTKGAPDSGGTGV